MNTESILRGIQLKNEIKYKKRLFAKMINIPELVDDAFSLKKEIETMEEELEKLQ